MLDKRAYKILEFIVNQTIDGDSVVLEKQEILNAVDNTIDEEELSFYIEDLALNELIETKYKDDNLFVVMPLAKGRVAAEKQTRVAKLGELITKPIEKEKFNYKKIGFIAGFCAFIGGTFAAIIAFILARFA